MSNVVVHKQEEPKFIIMIHDGWEQTSEFTLSEDEARDVYQQLREHFEPTSPITNKKYTPFEPLKNPEDNRWQGPYIYTCDGTGSNISVTYSMNII